MAEINEAQRKLATVWLPDKIGRGYGTMWRSRCRYVAVKGSRRSKKSKTQAQKIIYQLVKYPLSHALVVRRFQNTLRDSCYKELKWAIHNFGLDEYFRFKESPLEILYQPSPDAPVQHIYFRGLDDALKITSITVEQGCICWLWIEEAYEIDDEGEFDKLEESLLGSLPEGYYKQITLTFNPWSPSTWIKRRFFDVSSPDVLAITTNYMCNEWLSAEDRAVFDRMKAEQPARYRVSGLGEWGVDGAVFFEDFDQSVHVIEPFEAPEHWRMYRAIDYGLDMLAGLYIAEDPHGNAYVVGEVYQPGLKISDAAQLLMDSAPREDIYLTYAPPDLWARMKNTGKTVSEEFLRCGVRLTQAGNNRMSGWLQVLERLKVVEDVDGGKTARLKIFSTCKNLIRCISTIKADEKNCNDVATEPHELTHICDALRYWCISRTAVPGEPDRRTPEQRWADELAEIKRERIGGDDDAPVMIRR